MQIDGFPCSSRVCEQCFRNMGNKQLCDCGAPFKGDRLAALSARPAGDYVMVPRKPTEAMIVAGMPIADQDSGHPEDVWLAMIAARHAVGEDVVERVGLAIYAASGDNKWGAFSRARYDDIARAAIAAITGDDHANV